MNKIKYPRTKHLPWSLGKSDDDKVLESIEHFIGREVVVTEKMDGENTTLYFDGSLHARSMDSVNHESRTWLKNWWSNIVTYEPSLFNIRICGENLYARHSIEYNELPSYFMGFSLWMDDYCVSWDATLKAFKEFQIVPVREIYRGIYDEALIKKIWLSENTKNQEGYVIRLVDGFLLKDFGLSVAKFVRKNHVQTDKHWMNKKIIKNGLKSD